MTVRASARPLFVAAAAVAVASCTGGAEPADGTLDPAAAAALVSSDPLALGVRASGSRLRVRELATSEGAVEAAGFYDTVRNEPCAFRRDEVGAFRCLPSRVARVVTTNRSRSRTAPSSERT